MPWVYTGRNHYYLSSENSYFSSRFFHKIKITICVGTKHLQIFHYENVINSSPINCYIFSDKSIIAMFFAFILTSTISPGVTSIINSGIIVLLYFTYYFKVYHEFVNMLHDVGYFRFDWPINKHEYSILLFIDTPF